MGVLQILADSLDEFQRSPGVSSLWMPISTPAALAAHVLAAGHVFASSRRLTVGAREMSLLELCIVVSSLQQAFLQLRRYPADGKGVIRTLRPLCVRRAKDLSLPQPELKQLMETAAFVCSPAIREEPNGADDLPEEEADIPAILTAVESAAGPLVCAEGASLPSHVQVAVLSSPTGARDQRAAELSQPLNMSFYAYTDVGALSGVLLHGLAAGRSTFPSLGFPEGAKGAEKLSPEERATLSSFYANEAFWSYTPATKGVITIGGPVDTVKGEKRESTVPLDTAGRTYGSARLYQYRNRSIHRLSRQELAKRRDAVHHDLEVLNGALHSISVAGGSIPSSGLIRCIPVQEARGRYFLLPEIHPPEGFPDFQAQESSPVPKGEDASDSHQPQPRHQPHTKDIWYILMPSQHASSAITEANALFFLCAGEYRNASVLQNTPGYNYTEEQVAYAKGLQERQEVTALDVRGYQNDAFYCYRRGKKLLLVSSPILISEEKWRERRVAAIILSGSTSQLRSAPVEEAGDITAILRGRNAFYFYDASSAEGVSLMEGVPCKRLAIGRDQAMNRRAQTEFWEAVDRIIGCAN